MQEARRCGLQLGLVSDRELGKQPLAASREPEHYLSLVAFAGKAPNEAALDHPTHQLDRTVVSDHQALGNGADGRRTREALQREKELMLLRLNACGTGGRFTEVEEAADQEPDLG
jgi:hypothetical protein